MHNTAHIRILDEVNVHITGVDARIRSKMVKAVEFFLPSAKYSYLYKSGRWNGCTSFCTQGGRTYINVLDRLLPILQEAGYEIEIEDLRLTHKFEFPLVDENHNADICWPSGHRFAGEPIMLRDYQVDAINECLQNVQGINVLPTGSGKCQPLYARVKIPGGWTTMGQLQEGDQISVPDGTTATVTQVYDPGSKDVYEITFEDGRKVRSCEDHVWKIHNHDWKDKFKLLTLKQVIQLRSKNKRKVAVPLATLDQDTSQVDLPMHPYLLGVMMGDGSFRHGFGISSGDQFILDKFSSLLDPEYMIKHNGQSDWSIVFKDHDTHMVHRSAYARQQKRGIDGKIIVGQDIPTYHKYKAVIQSLGLRGTHSHTKFVPQVYLNSGYTQRLELIQGLMDTDGYVSANGSCYYTTVSEQLAHDFVYLIQSIGGRTKIKCDKNRTYTNQKGERRPCKDAYTVSVYHPTQEILVSLPRKLERIKKRNNRLLPLLHIVDIQKVSHEPVRCIMIDHPEHLYLTDGFVVTHNTVITATLSKIVEAYGRSIVIVPNKSLVTQTEADYRNLGLDVGVMYGDRKEYDLTHTICTWQSLHVLDKKHKDALDADQMDTFMKDLVCVIVDEVHSVKDLNVLQKLLTNNFKHIPIRWGLTGTLPEEEWNQLSLCCSIGPQIGELSAHELQEAGVLASCAVKILHTQETAQYTQYQDELKYLTTDPTRLKWLSDQIELISQSGNTLVLVDRIATGEFLKDEISGSIWISGDMKNHDRAEYYREMELVENRVVIATYGVAAVGISINRIFNVVLVEPGKSFIRVVQSIGRGLRKSNTKDHVTIWDIASKCKFSNNHLLKRKQIYQKVQYPYEVKKVTY
jgi:superfamily II DNA or RNA helicase